PYGGTAFVAGSEVEVKLKHYRYSGKERDGSTGLYYYGARYYAPWLGRWMSCDPAGTVDGLNLYAFVGGNPITYIDEIGTVRHPRAAKQNVEQTKKNPLRGTKEAKKAREGQRQENLASRKDKKYKNTTKKLKLGSYKDPDNRTKEELQSYPSGSYAYFRYLYLAEKLKDLSPQGLGRVGDNPAYVEVDHSPHDASQRGGKLRGKEEGGFEPLLYRVAVPLPRDWHRRHKTTHGPHASRYDAKFSQNQEQLVEAGKYYEALKKHLLDTFSPEAIDKTNAKIVEQVAKYTIQALDYAEKGNIPQKLHKHHKRNTSLINSKQRRYIQKELKQQLDNIAKLKNNLKNPF
ncbi:MAG: hypothetical protein F6K37_07915, partial [Moorea sp. SIO4E2]|uniref:RHS repeat-associated core domain-containing protein n=1 Tax=Moorena sp. SIO4E2 TaxID=2607826 RepID=UPI0013BAB186